MFVVNEPVIIIRSEPTNYTKKELNIRNTYGLCICDYPEYIYIDDYLFCTKCNKRLCLTQEEYRLMAKNGPTKDVQSSTRQFTEVKDSGRREAFPTGAMRDIQEGKGMPHLLPSHALLRLAQHFANGAKKYGPNNWRKGIPLSRYLDSCFRHWLATRDCLHDEDHPCSVMWNIACFIETAYLIEQGKLPKELDDIGWFEQNDRTK